MENFEIALELATSSISEKVAMADFQNQSFDP